LKYLREWREKLNEDSNEAKGFTEWPELRKAVEELEKEKDPLAPVTFWRFSGKFGFHEEEEAYAPLGDDIEKSRVMKEIYEKIEARRVEEQWEEAKEYLGTEDDGEPTLSY
jgi:hypothetical protein